MSANREASGRAATGSTDAPPVVTLLTDFGSRDPFAGVMKGVILRGAPRARIVDLTHEVPAHDVRAGAFLLESAFAYFARGTVHVGVVDPGVGSERRVIAARAGDWFFIGPDNGLLSLALVRAGGMAGGRAGGPEVVAVSDEAVARAGARALPAGAPLSRTFHGRDVFAPVAALVAEGAPLDELGGAVEDHVRIELPRPERVTDDADALELVGEVVHVDRFGNLVTNLRDEDIIQEGAPGRGDACVEFVAEGARVRGLSEAYADRRPGELLALVGSTGRIELSVREGSAARGIGAAVGTSVTVRVER